MVETLSTFPRILRVENFLSELEVDQPRALETFIYIPPPVSFVILCSLHKTNREGVRMTVPPSSKVDALKQMAMWNATMNSFTQVGPCL